MSRKVKAFYKVVVLGDSGVGKSALLHRYVRDVWVGDAFKSTIGADFLSKRLELDDGHSLTLQLWDTAGQERFVSLCVAFYRGADALILVCDLTRLSSAQSLGRWLEQFTTHTGLEPAEVPTLVLVNKADLAAEHSAEAVELARSWANSQRCPCAVVSALSGAGVAEAVAALAKTVWQRSEGDERGVELHVDAAPVDLDKTRTCPC